MPPPGVVRVGGGRIRPTLVAAPAAGNHPCVVAAVLGQADRQADEGADRCSGQRNHRRAQGHAEQVTRPGSAQGDQITDNGQGR